MADAEAMKWAEEGKWEEGKDHGEMNGLMHIVDGMWAKGGFIKDSTIRNSSLGQCTNHCTMYAEARGIQWNADEDGGKCQCLTNWDNLQQGDNKKMRSIYAFEWMMDGATAADASAKWEDEKAEGDWDRPDMKDMRVMCPGAKESDYCDGRGDCTETKFCDCDEGKALCEAMRHMEGDRRGGRDGERRGDRDGKRRDRRDGERRDRGEKMRFDFPERMGHVEVNPEKE